MTTITRRRPSVDPVPARTTPLGDGIMVEWLGLQETEHGEWVSLLQYPHKTITVSGGGEALIAIEGANDRTDPQDCHALHDEAQGWEIARPGCYVVREHPRFIRPRALAGVVNVRICAVRQ